LWAFKLRVIFKYLYESQRLRNGEAENVGTENAGLKNAGPDILRAIKAACEIAEM